MKTLTRWINKFRVLPLSFDCPDMFLQGYYDHEPPLFKGVGRIEIPDYHSFSFVMHADVQNGDAAFKGLVASQNNPYEIQHQFRLFATDYDGQKWVCGWLSPRFIESFGNTWKIGGLINGLSTHVWV